MYTPATTDKDIPTQRLVWTESGYVTPALRKAKSQFIKGPIPLTWISQASQLPGKALHVAVMLWYLYGVAQSKELVLSTARFSAWGVSRYQKNRALTILEEAGLIKVCRRSGRNPRVQILK